MELMEMADWPGTPGRTRMQAAEDIITEDFKLPVSQLEDETLVLDPASQDARMQLRIVDILMFSTSAHDELAELYNAEQINHATDLANIAVKGTNDKFIGMVIQVAPEEGDEDPQDAYLITCVNRDPEWVGLNFQLTHLKGLEVHVVGDIHDPDAHSIIIATDLWVDDTHELMETEAPDDPLYSAIREVALYHGATGCYWHRALHKK